MHFPQIKLQGAHASEHGKWLHGRPFFSCAVHESKAASKCRYRLCCISLAQEAKGLHGKAIKAVELLLLFRAPGDHLPEGADVFVVWHILHGEGGGP